MTKSAYFERVVAPHEMKIQADSYRAFHVICAHNVEMAKKRLRVRVDDEVGPGAEYEAVVTEWQSGAPYGIHGDVCFVRTDRIL